MVVATRDYVAIPKTTWLKIQHNINIEKLDEEEKIELWFISFDKLSQYQKDNYLEAKKINDCDFVNL